MEARAAVAGELKESEVVLEEIARSQSLYGFKP